jgi:putative ABC transport system permease protein
VIGVVADVRQSINQKKRDPVTIYIPHTQEPVQSITLVVRHHGDPGSLAAAMRRTLQGHDADMPLYEVRSMNEWLRYSLWEDRIYVSLMTVFAVLALVIAAIGIYGVLAYSVNQRTREIGLRMALGAPRGRVLRLIIREGMVVGAIGIGAGIVGALGFSRVLASLVFDVPVRDPLTYLVVAFALTIVAFAACVIPARKASRVDPMVALRCD